MNKKWFNITEVAWSVFWILFIILYASDKLLYFYFSEFTIIILFLLLWAPTDNPFDTRVIAILVFVIFLSPILYILSSKLVLIYFWLTVLLKVLQVRFSDEATKKGLVWTTKKNTIIIMVSGLIGFFYFSIIVYYIFKIIDSSLALRDREWLRESNRT
jgi:hypothetical protein